jgi:hypothetical protein
MKVKNINGTSKSRFVVSNLKKKYIQAGGKDTKVCQVYSCVKKATATAHVMKNSKDSRWYLTPMCAKHNSHTNHKCMGVCKNSLVALSKLKK